MDLRHQMLNPQRGGGRRGLTIPTSEQGWRFTEWKGPQRLGVRSTGPGGRAWRTGTPVCHASPLRCYASHTWTPNTFQTLGPQDVSWDLFVEKGKSPQHAATKWLSSSKFCIFPYGPPRGPPLSRPLDPVRLGSALDVLRPPSRCDVLCPGQLLSLSSDSVSTLWPPSARGGQGNTFTAEAKKAPPGQ